MLLLPYATEDLRKYVDHVIAEHGDKVLKLRTVILNVNTGKHGMMSKNVGFIPNDEMLLGQKVIMNREDWTVTACDTNERDDTEMVMANEVTLLERCLQNSLIDIESDNEEAIKSIR